MNNKNKLLPYLFVSPAIILVLVFYLIPVLVSFALSFTNMNLTGLVDYSKIKFINLDNYFNLFSNGDFLKSLTNTAFFVAVGVPLIIILSLSLALLINFETSKFSTFIRGVFYMPSITNIVAVSVVFLYLYNPKFGLFNYILKIFGVKPISWLFGGPYISKLSLIFLAVWRATGVSMIIFLAALKGVPKDFYEAADLDGVTPVQKFFKITLPLLSYSIFFVTITTIIGWIQFFDEPFIMTQGKPVSATLSLSLFVYQEGFKLNKFGYGATASFIMFILIMIITIVQFQIKKRIEKE